MCTKKHSHRIVVDLEIENQSASLFNKIAVKDESFHKVELIIGTQLVVGKKKKNKWVFKGEIIPFFLLTNMCQIYIYTAKDPDYINLEYIEYKIPQKYVNECRQTSVTCNGHLYKGGLVY